MARTLEALMVAMMAVLAGVFLTVIGHTAPAGPGSQMVALGTTLRDAGVLGTLAMGSMFFLTRDIRS